jgi:hypothetical protein
MASINPLAAVGREQPQQGTNVQADAAFKGRHIQCKLGSATATTLWLARCAGLPCPGWPVAS